MRPFRWAMPVLSVVVIGLTACGGSGAASTAASVAPASVSASAGATSPSASSSAPASAVSARASSVSGAASPSSAASPNPAAEASKPVVIIGSTNFAEQMVLGELYAQVLEAHGFKVQRKFNLGTREIVFPALQSGQIDMEADYLATLLAYVDKSAKPTTSPATTSKLLQQALTPKKLTVLPYAPAVDTNGFAVTQATAAKYKLKTLSDLKPVAGQMILGGAPECPKRPFCLPGLEKVYGLRFKQFKSLDTGGPVTVAALQANQVQVGELFTTDANITTHNFVLLRDNKHLQLADNIAPIVRDDVLANEGPAFKTTVDSIAPKLTTAELTNLNKQVGVDKKDPKTVAAAWLKKEGLV